MKLYDVPRNSKILVDPYGIIDFHHIDGMYSYCVDKHGNVVHLAAWMEVDVIEGGTCQPSHKRQ
jgi:hypothetical protein